MLIEHPSNEGTKEQSPRAEKVRGMNASLTEGPASPGPLKERDPGRLHITRRQIAFALILAVLAVVAAVFTVNAIKSGDRTYNATVTTSKVQVLNFPNNGKVTDILVKAGQQVQAGQVLARQDVTELQNQVAAAQGVVQADQQALAQTQAPQLTSAQQQQDQLQLVQAETALSNAQSALSVAEAQAKAQVDSAQASVVAAETLANTDQARYNQACPNGPVPPPSGLTGTAAQVAQAAYTDCQNLQLQLDRDTAAVTQAQAQLPSVTAQSQANVNQAQSTVNSAQATVNLVRYQQTLQTSPDDPVATAQAQANLSQAKGQLTAAQQALRQATILAPSSGTVAEVNGAVGEYLGPDGVHQYQDPAGVSISSSNGFQLFPTKANPSGNATNSAGNLPMIEIVGGVQQVMAQVPESSVSALHAGRTVQVSIPALHATVPGVVYEVVLTPAHTSGVQYDVNVTLSKTVAGLLPGMSATVRT